MKGIQFVTIVLIGSLFALTGLRQFFVEPLESSTSNLVWFGIQVLPLLAVLPGVLAMHARSFVFAALVAMLYFVHGVLLAVAPEQRVMGVFEAAFAVGLVLTGSYGARRLLTPQ